MTALTREWKLKTGENSVKYTVVVPNFRKKINSFKAGRSIWSKDFKVGRTVFCLAIDPSGEKSNSTDVGVYLYNKSDWDVIADVKFEVDDCKDELVKRRFDANGDGLGFPDLVPHRRCTNLDLLSDGQFHLEVYIELEDEEVLPHYDDVEDEVVSKMKSHVDKKFESMESKFAAMEVKFGKVEERIAAIEAGNSNSSRVLECPVCAEIVRRPMRLYQCGKVGSKYCC